LIADLDNIVFPDYEDIDMEFYTTASPYAIRGVFTRSFYISSSRGCPSSCSFCVSKKLRDYHGVTKFVRTRSADSLFREVLDLRKRYKIDSFYFIDDLFTLKKETVYKFCGLILQHKLPIIWGCSSKVNTVDFKLLQIMRDSGCVQIDFGVEKGSDKALIALKKGITIAQVKKTFTDCHKLGIRTFANMLVNTPQETEQDVKDVVELVEKIKPEIVTFNIFMPYPGCEIFDERCKDLKRIDYPRLMSDPCKLIKESPENFRFAAHNLDFSSWSKRVMYKYNRILPNLKVYLNYFYCRSLLHSRRKINYLHQIIFLVREFINQKFNIE